MRILSIMMLLAILVACDKPDTDSQSGVAETYSSGTDIGLLFSAIDGFDTGRISQAEISVPIKCTGKIDIPPTDVYSIHARMGGYIKKLYYLEGDKVRPGAVLVSLEDPKYIARQRELLELKHQLDLARKRLDRQMTLQEQGATTSKLYQEAEAQWSELNASYNGYVTELEMTGFSTDKLLENGVYQRSLHLTSPTAAIVNRINANTGQYVEPHDVIYELTGLDHIHLELNVLERDLPNIAIGQRVEFNLAGYDSLFHAEIVKIGAEVNEQTGALMVHCHMDDDEDHHAFRPGIFASARIIPESRKGYTLPASGALKEGAAYFGYVVGNNELVKTPLKNARAYDDIVQFDPSEDDLRQTWVISGAYYIDQ